MAVLTDFLTIETDIIQRVQALEGVNAVYRYPVDGLSERNVATPSLIVEYKGVRVGESVTGRDTFLLTTTWMVGVVASRADYLQTAGVMLANVIRQLRGYQAASWRHPARFANGQNKNQPEYDGNLVFYPATFEIDVVI